MTFRPNKTKVPGVFAFIAILSFLGSEVAADSSVLDANALNSAVQIGDIETARTLLDSGVDVNERNKFGSFALNAAAVENDIPLLRLLVERGANANAQSWSGDTALICATKYAGGKKDTVKLLLDAGTDVSLKDEDGKTALDYAKEKKQAEALALLEKSM